MKQKYPFKNLLFITCAFLTLIIGACKKDKSPGSATTVATVASPTKLGLYEVDSSIYKLLFMSVSKVGTQTINYDLIFDTGSGGLVIDADGILPKSMITSSGFNFTGDSTVVDGITITNQTSIVEYGDNAIDEDKVYGNLAYASVTLGDENGNIVVKRLPFFLYYKAVDSKGVTYDAHEFDVLGVSPQYDLTFDNNAYITSPFSYYEPGTGLTHGMKLAALGTSSFSYEGTYVPNVLTLGLTSSDLAASSGFVMHQLYFDAGYGYSPVVPGTIAYNSKSFSSQIVFDTGTEPYSYLEDKTSPKATTLLASNTSIAISTTAGFSYSYITSLTENLTYTENPSVSGSDVSIISLEFFLNNEYLLDYTNHQLGVKNN